MSVYGGHGVYDLQRDSPATAECISERITAILKKVKSLNVSDQLD